MEVGTTSHVQGPQVSSYFSWGGGAEKGPRVSEPAPRRAGQLACIYFWVAQSISWGEPWGQGGTSTLESATLQFPSARTPPGLEGITGALGEGAGSGLGPWAQPRLTPGFLVVSLLLSTQKGRHLPALSLPGAEPLW